MYYLKLVCDFELTIKLKNTDNKNLTSNVIKTLFKLFNFLLKSSLQYICKVPN